MGPSPAHTGHVVVRLPLLEGHMNRALYDRARYLHVDSPTQALTTTEANHQRGILTCSRPQGKFIKPLTLIPPPITQHNPFTHFAKA